MNRDRAVFLFAITLLAALMITVALLAADPASPRHLPVPCHTGAPPVALVCPGSMP